MFQFIGLDLYKPVNIDGALFGINVSRVFLYLDLFWFRIKIFDLR